MHSGPFIFAKLGFSARKPNFSRAHACGHAFGKGETCPRMRLGRRSFSFAFLASGTRVDTRSKVWHAFGHASGQECDFLAPCRSWDASGDAFAQKIAVSTPTRVW